MSDFEQLLELQTRDTSVDQLRHRRDTLPERAQLRDVEQSQRDLDTRIAKGEGRRDDLAREQRRLEDEVASIEAKVAEVDKSLYCGGITSPREAQALQDELAALKRRQTTLEDDILEVMEQLEPVRADLERLGSDRVRDAGVAEGLRAAITAHEAEIDVQIDEIESERRGLVADIGPDRLADYQKLRARLGGVAVARLVEGRCGGCHLTLSAVEVDRIKGLPPDARVACEECGRLLVR